MNVECIQHNDLFRTLVDSIQCGIYFADTDGNIIYANQEFAEVLGYKDLNEVEGMNIHRDIYFRRRDRMHLLDQMNDKGYLKNYEIKVSCKDGSKAILSLTSTFIKDFAGDIIGTAGVMQDVTKNKELAYDLQKEKYKLEQIVNFDEKVGMIRKNDKLFDFVVRKSMEILDAKRCSLMLIDDDSQELCIKSFSGIDEKIVRDTRIRLGDSISGLVALKGHPLLVEDIENNPRFGRPNNPSYKGKSFIVMPINIDGKTIGVINLSDKMQGERAESFNYVDLKVLYCLMKEFAVAIENVSLYKELKFLSETDPLTHIFNYRHFTKSLDCDIKRARRMNTPLSLMMIDVDDFKDYNDSFGHLEGDKLLKSISKVFTDNLREIDIVCRYAGDEFMVILPNTGVNEARIVAEKIIAKIKELDLKREIYISVGIAGFDKNLTRYEYVLKVDQAMYIAKTNEKDRICVFN